MNNLLLIISKKKWLIILVLILILIYILYSNFSRKKTDSISFDPNPDQIPNPTRTSQLPNPTQTSQLPNPTKSVQSLTVDSLKIQTTPKANTKPVVQPTQSPQEARAQAEQIKADQEYTNWQIDKRTSYPWMKKLPLHTEKYYVYFDLDKTVFIGLLYPAPTDNVDQMKLDIIKQLRDVKGVPVENYNFEWTVSS